ncbi:translocation/assembly module TamB domain-containing protein [Sphingomonas sp. BIUV-7]|uniref:Translocation/assembly module TamB domain-containing protein n=1 Tax=Sphingomonas natans TaxID=3063330 RepID=A0ABT8YC34_9SPHN|nr:translocation/assembly module TamB domain-containing protein [Sphingomonas sp. BIUV-7]MDO6415542.1 translocation/assembly module TamB domain-containing protein [Sphingomonas sp. BIUV-7]
MALRIAKWIGIGLATLVALIGLLLLALNTGPGKRLIANQLAGFETASGLNFRVSRITGSIYGHMVLRGVEVRDTKGAFITVPEVTIDWRPFAYAHSKIDVREFTAPLMIVQRNPALKVVPSDPNAPLLPDIDLSLRRLRIDRLIIQPPVTGQRHIVKLAGSAEIADGRAQLNVDAGALRGAGIAGGDRLHLVLDARPDANRFGLDARLEAPKGGLVDSYAKLGKPLSLLAKGNGDWADWKGRLTGALGGEALAKLDVTGRNGTFRSIGAIRPGLILTGPAARLTEPAIQLDLVTALAGRKVDTKLVARSSAFALDAAGLIDLGASRLGNLRINASLLKPGAIAPNVSARDLRLAATLDGAFATPTIDYRLTAATIGFDATIVRGLAASGKAVISTERILVPVHATARAVTGLNAAAGGLLTNIRIDGDIAYQEGKVASDNLRIRSDRIDATALILADLAKGTYTGAIKGRVNDYDVNGLGRINLVTDAKLVPGIGGGFAIRGKVRIVTRRLTNESVRDQLGGNALITADVGYDLAGGASIRNLRLTAPKLRITRGDGFYRPNGQIGFKGAALSQAYGPVTVEVSGTVAKPVAHLRAARPGLGANITNLDATLTGTGRGYRVRAAGQSDYGPFSADVMLNTGRGPMSFDIASAVFAGIRFGGHVAQTPAGPFAGLLTMEGSGLNGTVRLAAAGSVQRADIDVRANSARVPGPAPITIGSGTVRATVLMTPGAPSVTGTFALADLRSGQMQVARAQGRIDYRGGQGKVALVARGGQAGAPFDIAAQAALSPTRVVANLRGTLNGIPVHLARPAVVTKGPAGWTLAPATLVLPQGQVDLTGGYGARTTLQARLRSLDLSIANAFVPGLGLGGKASGTVDYTAAGTVPDLRARIDIARFTRTASLVVSQPVDIALLATLNGTGGDARALIRRGGAVLGRMQARLAPLGAGASLSERLLASPLSGGIRYNGPAEILWTLTGIAKQQLSGSVAIGADFGGRLDQPSITGIVRANALRYENETYGTVLANMVVDGRFTRSEFLLNRLTAKAGDGSVSASGRVGLDAASGFPIDIQAKLDRARLARGDDIDATATGTIAITNSKAAGGLVKGEINIPEARYAIVRQGAAAVPELTGIRRKGAPPVVPEASALPSNWKLDVHIRADNQIFVSGMGLEAEWKTDMRVGGTSTAPNVVGKLEVVRGTYSFAGRRFDIDHGIVTFQGGMLNPALDIAANTTVDGVTATIAIGGYAQAPRITFTSSPTLPQDEVLSRLLFGSSVTSLSPTQAIQLAAALNSLRGSGGGLNPLGKLRTVAGIDRLRVLGADESAGRGTALAAGKYISNNIYVEIVTDARGFTATQLEVSLSKALSVLSQTGSFGGSNVSLRYKKSY